MFASFGWVNCIGLFQAEYETNQLKGYSSSDVAWITSLEFFFMLALSPVAGKLFDSYGPRVPIVIGSPQTWFRKKRGIAGGLVITGSSLGGVVFPLIVQHLMPKVGFGWTMRICAFLILALLLFTVVTISSSMNHSPRPFNLVDYIRPLREPNFVTMSASCFFLYWGMFVPFDYIVLNAVHYGMSPYTALSLVPIMNGASFIGRTVPNYIADKLGRFNVTIVMTALSAVVVLALWLPGRGDGAFISFAVLFGITSGAGIGLGPVLIASISPIGYACLRTHDDKILTYIYSIFICSSDMVPKETRHCR
ncbi:MFS general substrate transporter [Coniochaeta hoffmannii]|uniref:MFS general substrate transporter n=1 Tax=Coniochaeta hoffmannii TaxID=91930 RepID=A0AA38VFJ3_9PEZI|nr:MFS general substrate transporter [Coniochaeta hoffmannii]